MNVVSPIAPIATINKVAFGLGLFAVGLSESKPITLKNPKAPTSPATTKKSNINSERKNSIVSSGPDSCFEKKRWMEKMVCYQA